MTFSLKWNGNITENIAIGRSTRQGGLMSHIIFNLFYRDLITELNNFDCGTRIGSQSYNIFAYADHILPTSTTVPGLQTLIDSAVKNITVNGLCFNPNKTECTIVGGCPFIISPGWKIGNINLNVSKILKYLETEIGDRKGDYHCESRIRAANRSFYSQGAGLYSQGVDPYVAVHIYNTAVKCVLLYGCNTINITKSNVKKLEVCLRKHVKTILYYTEPLITNYPNIKCF